MSHRLVVSGNAACFPRLEFKSELVTYDVITPIAARRLFEAIHWTPAIRWRVESLQVLHPIRTRWVDRGQAAKALELIDVRYVLCARFDLTELAGPRDNAAQHANMFRTRLKRQQFFRQPYLGRRDLVAEVKSIDRGEQPMSHPVPGGEVDLGWMPYDRDFAGDHRLLFYRPRMIDGVIDLEEVDPRALPS